jgi:hypothetical protein
MPRTGIAVSNEICSGNSAVVDPFTIAQTIADAFGASPLMAASLTAIVAGMIGFAIVSLMAGKPMRAIKVAVAGLALLLFLLFSQVSSLVTAI